MPFLNPPYNPYSLGHIVGTALTVTAATNASPIVVTVAAHGYNTGNNIRIASVTGNTNANGDWVVTVVDANTFSLNGSSGNAGYSGGGTSVRFLLPLTYNHPEYANQGFQVNSLTFQAFASNTGNVYVGGIVAVNGTPLIPKRVTPFTDMIYVIKPGAVQNMPFFSPGNSNIINIDQFGIDWDTAGEGCLVSAFTK